MSTRTDSMPVTQAVHDLGSALWFGGATMGVVGVNSAGRDLEQGVDRIRVASSAWRRLACSNGPASGPPSSPGRS